MRRATLAMTKIMHEDVFDYLFPGDGLEAVGVLLCNQGTGKHYRRLLAVEFLHLPHKFSERRSDFVSWPFDEYMTPDRIGEVDRKGRSIVTIHSHPKGGERFSEVDDRNDRDLLKSINGWFDDGRMNGVAVMTPDGLVAARTMDEDARFRDVEAVSVVGESIHIWKPHRGGQRTEYQSKMSQTFGQGTLELLKSMKIGVVGCSGTGSIVIELLTRNCVGELVIVDDDILSEKNLNRIVSGTMKDAYERRPKVTAIREAVEKTGLETRVEAYRGVTDSPEVVAALIDCDAIFGCVDSAFGRYHLDCLASAYLIPYFDVGVHVEADGTGGIRAADAVSHYMHPDGRSLISRGAYTMEQVAAEDWRRTDPAHYQRQRVAGYLAEVGEEQPAVMSVNMQAACMAFNDFMARIHAYRLDANREFGTQRFRLVHGCYEHEADTGAPHPLLGRYAGTGDGSLLVRNNTRRG